MTSFRVWAPAADQVELEVDGRRVVMTPADRGWHAADVDALPGTDYAFVLDGGDPLPDPRSAWQPAGVHGPSRLVDHAAYEWADGDWRGAPFDRAVVYELHVGTFTAEGTLDAALGKLDHLLALGITHIELLPVVSFSGDRGWGYDGVDLWSVHSAYGGPDALKRFVDTCHQRGLAVLLDVVYNHLGPSGNYLGRFGPYFTDRYRTPWGAAVNYDDAGSDGVREFVVENALMWLRDYHLDGLRLDAVHAIHDESALHLLEEIAERVDALGAEVGRPLTLIAESDLNDPRVVRERSAGGLGMTAQWSDDFHHALHSVLTGETSGYYADYGSLGQLAKALRQAFVYDGCYSALRDRRFGRKPDGLPRTRFLGYLQNHDQIGNRATGERSSHLLSEGRLRVAAALVLLSPFVPMLFQGEEWGATTPFQYFTSHEDEQLAESVRVGRRREFAAFGWRPEDVPDPQDPATFERSKLDWSQPAEPPHAGLLEWHRRLIALRRDLATDGSWPKVGYDEQARWLTVSRLGVTVAANLGDQPVDIPVDGSEIALASDDAVHLGDRLLALPPSSVAAVR
ncbi:MAG TPA: malto-oligosyltrehalose trehalohydrolase [Mycobacteriales bacterium]|nr:malto-oligosyltrehalose trehalohydrolase [Mycobacteriales bacterium]